MAPTPAAPKTTPLHARHVALGARMTPFGGWDMPVQYGGIAEEHEAVRTAAGLFDVSHMGEVEIAGDDALAAVQHIASNDARRLEPGRAQYSALTTPEGTVVTARRSTHPAAKAFRSLLRHGHRPTIDRAEELCTAVGITMTIGKTQTGDDVASVIEEQDRGRTGQ